MPIYEYRCAACGHDFERYVPSGTTTVACPTCRSEDVTRKLSVVAFKTGGGLAGAASPSGGGCCGGGCGCR
ncbi:MAG TPA: zinc ribbon domain-containing protein [Candidatus Binatia bacterium]|nr:zinc ribbon domain-containing protein [Candidatus Binatia bacterium]